jgi:3-dehydroquinate synthase
MSKDAISITFDSAPFSAKQEIVFVDKDESLSDFFDCQAQKLIVTDSNVCRLKAARDFIDALCAKKNAVADVFEIPAGEQNKTIENVLAIVKNALDAGMNRKSVFIALGGGVVTDLTGFAASIFMRGASWEAIPTTLLGMVDAAIGGKTGCDFYGGKNILGSFFPARRVLVKTHFAQTLRRKEYFSGLGEAFKTALLFNPALYDFFKTARERVLEKEPDAVMFLARECAREKARVVQEDFMETGNRALLNFGHTFAHALESAAGFGNVTHGDAVAWGIARALDLSRKKRLCAPSYQSEVFACLESFGWQSSPRHTALPSSVTPDDLLRSMKKDKKKLGNLNRLILQRGIADTVIVEVPDDEVRDVLL